MFINVIALTLLNNDIKHVSQVELRQSDVLNYKLCLDVFSS